MHELNKHPYLLVKAKVQNKINKYIQEYIDNKRHNNKSYGTILPLLYEEY